MATNELHSTGIEIVAYAHHALVTGGTGMKTPEEACAEDLDEIVAEIDSVPTDIVRARDALRDGDRNAADEALQSFLAGTEYDPADPDSFHPSNG